MYGLSLGFCYEEVRLSRPMVVRDTVEPMDNLSAMSTLNDSQTDLQRTQIGIGRCIATTTATTGVATWEAILRHCQI